MQLINGPKFSEFLDKHKNRSLDRDDIASPLTLESVGVQATRKTDPRRRILEILLLRTSLYRSEEGKLVPFLIATNWSDYALAWTIKDPRRDSTIHVPFWGRIAFLCDSPEKKWVCHPDSGSSVQKIFVDLGRLTFRDEKGLLLPRYHKKPFLAVINAGRDIKTLTSQDIQHKFKEIELTKFKPERVLEDLVKLGFVSKADAGYHLDGEGLLLTELSKVESSNDAERLARLLLRRDLAKGYYQIATVLGWLESQEKMREPSDREVGVDGKDENMFKSIVEGSSVNAPAIANCVRDYSEFGGYIDWYQRDFLDEETRIWRKAVYSFLTCCMDSVGYLSGMEFGSNLPSLQNMPAFKHSKLIRHLEYLKKHLTSMEIKEITNRLQWSRLQSKLRGSEIIDYNPDQTVLHALSKLDTRETDCPSNIFLATKVPISIQEFKNQILLVLNERHRFKTSQGAYRYPDFRFLLSSRLGLTFRAFDEILAYACTKDVNFRVRLWFFVAFGVPEGRKIEIEPALRSTIREPFDHIALRW